MLPPTRTSFTQQSQKSSMLPHRNVQRPRPEPATCCEIHAKLSSPVVGILLRPPPPSSEIVIPIRRPASRRCFEGRRSPTPFRLSIKALSPALVSRDRSSASGGCLFRAISMRELDDTHPHESNQDHCKDLVANLTGRRRLADDSIRFGLWLPNACSSAQSANRRDSTGTARHQLPRAARADWYFSSVAALSAGAAHAPSGQRGWACPSDDLRSPLVRFDVSPAQQFALTDDSLFPDLQPAEKDQKKSARNEGEYKTKAARRMRKTIEKGYYSA